MRSTSHIPGRLLMAASIGLFVLMLLMLLTLPGCKHEPVLPEIVLDDLGGNGGGGVNEQPCDTNVIYYQQQVQPILTTYCTSPAGSFEGHGCHHTATHDNKWIDLTSYAAMYNSDEAFDPSDPLDSDMWDEIQDGDMPPQGSTPLPPELADVIYQWLQQGGLNTSCASAACDTLSVTYAGTIQPLVQQKCGGCHGGNSPAGGLALGSWPVLNTVALDGRLESAILHQGLPNTWMPPSGGMLPPCDIDKFLIWIQDGAPQ